MKVEERLKLHHVKISRLLLICCISVFLKSNNLIYLDLTKNQTKNTFWQSGV